MLYGHSYDRVSKEGKAFAAELSRLSWVTVARFEISMRGMPACCLEAQRTDGPRPLYMVHESYDGRIDSSAICADERTAADFYRRVRSDIDYSKRGYLAPGKVRTRERAVEGFQDSANVKAFVVAEYADGSEVVVSGPHWKDAGAIAARLNMAAYMAERCAPLYKVREVRIGQSAAECVAACCSRLTETTCRDTEAA